jgi:hypothetical protein
MLRIVLQPLQHCFCRSSAQHYTNSTRMVSGLRAQRKIKELNSAADLESQKYNGVRFLWSTHLLQIGCLNQH